MSNRTVVSVQPRGADTIEVRLWKAPGTVQGAREPQLFDCDPDRMPPWSQPDAVQAHGRTIFDRLATHKGIKVAIEDLQKIQPPQIRSLYFHLIADDAERLSWETLCDSSGTFLALDKRWPIARMADSEVDQRLPQGDFVPPLKIMAILSAMSRPARLEWKSLSDAVRAERDSQLPIELIVFVSEQALLTEIQNQVTAEKMTWVTVGAVPDRVDGVDRALARHQPHILHFYCHGSTSTGVAQLQLATINDWDAEKPTMGSLIVKLDELLGFTALPTVWLVTLNCCEGGKAANDLHSMAHRLVAGGVPASVGMIEPINAPDAHEFAEVFYPALLTRLRRALADARAAGTSIEFEWAPALHAPRTALRDRHRDGDALAHRVWTLPVLYVRPEPFELRHLGGPAGTMTSGAHRLSAVGTVDPVMRSRIDAIAGALRALPPDTPPVARVELIALLADVPVNLLPHPDGTFSGGA